MMSISCASISLLFCNHYSRRSACGHNLSSGDVHVRMLPNRMESRLNAKILTASPTYRLGCQKTQFHSCLKIAIFVTYITVASKNLVNLTDLKIRKQRYRLAFNDSFVFQGLSRLVHLEFADDRIHSLPAGLFANLPSLNVVARRSLRKLIKRPNFARWQNANVL